MTILSRTRGGWLWMALLAAASAFAGRDADSPRIGQLPLDGQWVPADLRIAIVGPDWQDVVYLDTAALLQREAQPGGSLWRAELPAGTLGGGARL